MDNYLELYSRQIALPEIMLDGQKKIADSHILVVGAGGIGSAVLLYLASSGIGKITIVDDDCVSLSNLHRQILFTQADINNSKAVTACNFLKSRYPSQEFIHINKCLDTPIAEELVPNIDLIIDGTDSLLSKYILSDIAVKYKKPLIIGAVVGFSGYVAGFNHHIAYRDIFPYPPKQSPSCNEVGILPSSAGQISMLIVTEALKLITNIQTNIIGKIIRYNGLKSEFSNIDFSGIDNKTYKAMPEIICLSDHDLTKYQDYYFIDVRSNDEVSLQPFDIDFLNIPIDKFLDNLHLPLLNKNIVFICKTSRRSQMALLHYSLSNNNQYSKLYFYRKGSIS